MRRKPPIDSRKPAFYSTLLSAKKAGVNAIVTVAIAVKAAANAAVFGFDKLVSRPVANAPENDCIEVVAGPEGARHRRIPTNIRYDAPTNLASVHPQGNIEKMTLTPNNPTVAQNTALSATPAAAAKPALRPCAADK